MFYPLSHDFGGFRMAVMEAMAYDRTMYFKTDRQTRLGTAATGQFKNHTFALCPKPVKITNYAQAYADIFKDNHGAADSTSSPAA